MAVSYCFFDLDGTLVDSSAGIIDSINYALDKMALPPFRAEEVTYFIGPPLATAFSSRRGLSPEDTQRAVNYYREHYRTDGIFACSVYGGIRELLQRLTKSGITCVLATCKPHEYANRILEHHELASYFSFVSGPELDGTRNEKHEVIAYALQKLQIKDPSQVVMIGDRANDILGARENKIDTIGVLWGFGSREELMNAGAKSIVSSPDEILF